MDLQLTDKRALISGSTKGIGLAIATALAREGARVIINGRTEASVSAARSEILGSVPKAAIEGFAGDLATSQAAELLGAKFPSVDILVNNLGIFVNQLSGGQPFAEFEKEFFKSVRPSSLLKRFIKTEEVASLVAYVCSPLAAATNGAALRVDGGVVQACF